MTTRQEKRKFIKKIIIDFGLSIVASSISIIGLQIIIYPAVAKIFGGNAYGELLLVMAVVNIVAAAFGSTLNNTRLIQNKEYIENNEQGDFNIILTIACSLAAVVIIVIGNSTLNFDVLDNIFVSACVILGVYNTYMNVGYRLKLNYKMLIASNISRFCGYMFGIFLAYKMGRWIFAFLFGEVFDCILLSLTTHLLKEPYKTTILLKKTIKKYGILVLTGLLVSVTVYLDRFIIYPILGAEYVSVYTVASFFGKALGLIMAPIAGVLLSYYAQRDFKMNMRKFLSINVIFLLLSIFFVFFSNICSVWVTGLLYPTLIDSAAPYIMLANLASIIGVLAYMVMPMVLMYSNIYWQVIIHVVYLIVYFGLGTFLLSTNGLIGFCIAAICANLLKILLLYIAGAITFFPHKSVDERLSEGNV